MHDGHDESEPVSEAINRIGRSVMDAAFTVHRALGPGLLGSVYEACMAEELRPAGLGVERQIGVPIAYCETRMDVGYRLG